MSEMYVINHAAPTLAGLKTGNLFPYRYSSYELLQSEIRSLNRRLSGKGLRLIPLRRNETQALLYLYRPERLTKDLAEEESKKLLCAAGYTDLRQERCLAELIRRLQKFEAFPHEIGLFLSYPPEDVRGFMEHHGKNSKYDGCWKVYGDVERARRLFAVYKKCTECYRHQSALGVPVEHLAVR